MITYQITSTAIGVGLALVILWLVRRDHLHGPFAIWWIGVAITVALLGFFTGLFDKLAHSLGITYPPILAVVLGFSMLLVKVLTQDLERSRQERVIRRLAQRLAILEAQHPDSGALAVSGPESPPEPPTLSTLTPEAVSPGDQGSER